MISRAARRPRLLSDRLLCVRVRPDRIAPFDTEQEAEELAQQMDLSANEFPYLVMFTVEQTSGDDYDYGAEEFEFGLELILDRLARCPGPGAGASAVQ